MNPEHVESSLENFDSSADSLRGLYFELEHTPVEDEVGRRRLAERLQKYHEIVTGESDPEVISAYQWSEGDRVTRQAFTFERPGDPRTAGTFSEAGYQSALNEWVRLAEQYPRNPANVFRQLALGHVADEIDWQRKDASEVCKKQFRAALAKLRKSPGEKSRDEATPTEEQRAA